MGGGNDDGLRGGMACSGTGGKQADVQSVRRGQAGSPGGPGSLQGKSHMLWQISLFKPLRVCD